LLDGLPKEVQICRLLHAQEDCRHTGEIHLCGGANQVVLANFGEVLILHCVLLLLQLLPPRLVLLLGWGVVNAMLPDELSEFWRLVFLLLKIEIRESIKKEKNRKIPWHD